VKPEELERSFSEGQVIIERGLESRELFVIRSGNVVLDTEDGSTKRLVGPGCVFGEIGAIHGGASPYRAEAEEEVTVLALDHEMVNKLIQESPEFSARLIRHLADEVAIFAGDRGTRSVEDLSDAYEKLVPAIFGASQGNESPYPVHGNLKELANAASISSLEAYFCVQRLLENRVLRLVDDQLSIVDSDQLRSLGA